MKPKKFMGVLVTPEMFAQKDMSAMEYLLLAMLWSLSNREEGCTVTNEWLAIHLNCTTRTISDSIKKFKERGYITYVNESNRRVINKGEQFNKGGNFFNPDGNIFYRLPTDIDGKKQHLTTKKTTGGLENISRGLEKNNIGVRKKQHTDILIDNITDISTDIITDNLSFAKVETFAESEPIVQDDNFEKKLFNEKKTAEPISEQPTLLEQQKKENKKRNPPISAAPPKSEKQQSENRVYNSLVEIWFNYYATNNMGVTPTWTSENAKEPVQLRSRITPYFYKLGQNLADRDCPDSLPNFPAFTDKFYELETNAERWAYIGFFKFVWRLSHTRWNRCYSLAKIAMELETIVQSLQGTKQVAEKVEKKEVGGETEQERYEREKAEKSKQRELKMHLQQMVTARGGNGLDARDLFEKLNPNTIDEIDSYFRERERLLAAKQ